MNLREYFLVAFLVLWLSLIVLFWHLGLHPWAILWGVIFLAVVITELVSKLTSGKTISQRWWAWGEQHPIGKWFLLGTMGVAWALLLGHLGCR